jgi:hypothetical protein
MKPIIILSVFLIATLSIGVDLAERIEMRAQHDRLSFGAEAITLAAQ